MDEFDPLDGVEVTGAELVVLRGRVTVEDGTVLINGKEYEVNDLTFELQPGQVLTVADVSTLEEGEALTVVVRRPEPRSEL